MKKFLVDYTVQGMVFQSYMTASELDDVRNSGDLVCFRKLSHGEIMEIANYSF